MKLSTSTNILFLRPDGSIYPPKKAVEQIVKAGFRYLDFNFYDWVKTQGSPYMGTDGDQWFKEMVLQAETLGVSYEQAHAHFFNFADPNLGEEDYRWHQKQVIRSIKNAAFMGAKVIVSHPCTVFSREGSYYRISKEKNVEYFKKVLDETKDTGIKIALENMTDIDTAPKKKYCAEPGELAELVDLLGDERIGVCWDFEHGDLMGQNQPEIVKFFGELLIATHVSDSHGYFPVHLTHRLPMTGTIDWREIVEALREINYQGCFSYEAHNYLNTLPDCAVDSALHLAWDIGNYLMEMKGGGV